MSIPKRDANLDEKLAEWYNDPKFGLRSARLLWSKVREGFKDNKTPKGFRIEPSLAYVKNWLANQASHSTHTLQPVKHYFPVTGNRYAPFQRVQMDIMYPGRQRDKPIVGKEEDKEKTCILVIIDTVTRYLFAYPMKDNSGEEVIRVFKLFIRDLDRINQFQPVEIDCDKEAAFENNLKDWCDDNGLNIEFKTNSMGVGYKDRLALAFVDRAIRTLRSLLDKYQIQHDTTDWVNGLPDLVKNYNESTDESTNVSPIEMVKGSFTEDSNYELGKFNDNDREERLKDKARNETWYKRDIEPGDRVRVPVDSTNFTKRSRQRWRTLPYRIKSIENGIYYTIDESNAVGMRKKYKKYELLPVRDSLHSNIPLKSVYGDNANNEGGLRRDREMHQIRNNNNQ